MTRKNMEFHNQDQAEFAERLLRLSTSKSDWQAWSDFVLLSSISIANAMEQEEDIYARREQEYLHCIGQYSPDKQKIFPEMLRILIQALEKKPEQDFLGEMFMTLNLNSHCKGQFFTPYDIGQVMSLVTIENCEKTIQEKGWISVYDLCCGAGSLLIATRNGMAQRGLGPRQALYVAQDIDRTTALMCYLQLSLLGCAGYVIVGDALLHPSVSPTGSPLLISPSENQEIWIMPALYDEVWLGRILLERIQLLMRGT